MECLSLATYRGNKPGYVHRAVRADNVPRRLFHPVVVCHGRGLLYHLAGASGILRWPEVLYARDRPDGPQRVARPLAGDYGWCDHASGRPRWEAGAADVRPAVSPYGVGKLMRGYAVC